MNHNNLVGRSIHCGDVVDWEFLTNKGLAQYDLLHKGITFRLGGVEREMSLLELGWRVGLYNVGNTKAKSIRNPRIRLAHCYITITITGRKETTHRVTEIDLFYLYCIFGEGIVCNIPYWLAKYLKSLREKGMIFQWWCLWPKISRSFGLLTEEMVMRGGEGDDEEGDEEGGNKGVGGSTDVYRDMSTDLIAHWMYDHRLFPRKLKSRWYGPFSVSKDMKNGAIELYDEEGSKFIVNKQRVKPYQKNLLDTNKDDDVTLDDEGEVT
ncbi:hypothetical protein Tco_0519425 [Tanacetum coccineum]